VAAGLLGLLLAGCATFPDDTGPRDWREKLEGVGELGRPPVVPDPGSPEPPPRRGEAGQGGPPAERSGCVDPDPQVVATCLEPVGAIAVLPDAESALVAERTTGRVLRVQGGREPELVATVEVDPAGGGLTGLVLSPYYAEDQLVYAYATTAVDNRVVRIAPGEAPKPVLVGIPRGPGDNGGALAVDVDGSLLVATADAGAGDVPGSLAGKLLRIDIQGRPAVGNPDPASPVLSSGLHSPGGICIDPRRTTTWVTDRTPTDDALHLVQPGPLPSAPAWRWPDRPGVAGCVAQDGTLTVVQSATESVFVMRTDVANRFTGTPETLLQGSYGSLSAAAPAPDGLLWLGTTNKTAGTPVSTDDRAIRIRFGSGGESRD
jgi:glucose/arabinose dehydrogenase